MVVFVCVLGGGLTAHCAVVVVLVAVVVIGGCSTCIVCTREAAAVDTCQDTGGEFGGRRGEGG